MIPDHVRRNKSQNSSHQDEETFLNDPTVAPPLILFDKVVNPPEGKKKFRYSSNIIK